MTAWPAGAATGVGSLPGTDPAEAVSVVLGELPLLPHLPELPARGPGADMIGRGATFLVDLPVEIQPSGWRLTAHPGRDVRRARDFLSRDLDALESAASGWDGAVKVQVVGPWTLAASLELPTGHRVVSDHGAVRDLSESLAEGVRVLTASLRERLPSASVVVQLDEPSLPTVLAGRVPTPSGYGTVRAVAPSAVEQVLAAVLACAPDGGRVVHCCAPDSPVALLRSAGADAVSIDLSLVGPADYDTLGEALDGGMSLWAGIVPSTDAAISFDTARSAVLDLWNRLGLPVADLAGSVVPTPTCGLARASSAYARRAMAVLTEVARALGELA